MEDINASIGFDRKMWRQDIRGSLAHAAMLGKIGIISQADVVAIGDGLKGIAAEIESGAVPVHDRARRHSHEHRGAADRCHWRCRQTSAHRAQPQWPGGDRFSS
jgi:hypothetical protein